MPAPSRATFASRFWDLGLFSASGDWGLNSSGAVGLSSLRDGVTMQNFNNYSVRPPELAHEVIDSHCIQCLRAFGRFLDVGLSPIFWS